MEQKGANAMIIKRAAILGIVMALLFFGLLLRIFLIQTRDFDKYQGKVISQLTTESKVNAERGNIYDANGILIATNITRYRVFISPSSIAKAQKKANEEGKNIKYDELISKNLSEILEVEYDKVLLQTTYTKYLDRTIKKSVEEESANEVRAFIDEYDLENMIYLEAVSERYYPYGSLASHVIGFTGSDGQGLYGLELQYDSYLRGTAGKYIVARDAQGNEMPYSYDLYIPQKDGDHLYTTLDVFVQSALERALQDTYAEHNVQNRVCGIVMDVNTGAVKAMATYPNFDLNSPRELNEASQAVLDASGLLKGSEEYDKLHDELMKGTWNNKAVTESYIPGSTFKIITSSMALEENKVSMSEDVFCKGSKNVSGFNIHCHKVLGHGSLSFAEGLQQSCNVWFMTLGERLGTEVFQKYFNAFGYNKKTGIDLPGESNSVISSSMSNLDLVIYAFGQNFNVTPIQQITAVSAVANGGHLVTPHLLDNISDNDKNVILSYESSSKRQVISSSTSATLREILEDGVSGSGGAKNAYVPGYRIAAKTGTSEKKERECPVCDSTANPVYDENGMVVKKEDKIQYICSVCRHTGDMDKFEVSEDYICSCIGFAPAENPQYAVIIIADEPTSGLLYGSTVAAPYVADVFESVLDHLGVEPVYSEKELENMAVAVPTLKNWSVKLAKDYLDTLGLEIEIIGDGNYVKKQFPEADSVIEKGTGRVIVYTSSDTEEKTSEVPNLVGLTASAANKLLKTLNLNVNATGAKSYISNSDAYVVSQSVSAGTTLSQGSVVTVELKYLDGDDITPDVDR